MKKPLFLAAAFSALAACASSPAEGALEAAAAAPAVNTVPNDGLPPQRLAPGECGLFLWSMSAPRKFVFFTNGSSGAALVLIGDKPTSISMTSAGGDVFGQFLTKMMFEDLTSNATVKVSIAPGKPLDGGQRVEGGNIQFRDEAGWETVLPVTGVRACMPG